MERMAEVLLDEPNHYLGWLTMIDWCHKATEARWCLQSAEALVRIDPQHETGFGCLGDARLLNGDRLGAIEAYRHALELNPKYEYGGNSLFDLQLADGDLDGAARTLDTLRAHGPTDSVRLREAQLAARFTTSWRAWLRHTWTWMRRGFQPLRRPFPRPAKPSQEQNRGS
jgi:hypothetical protein